MKMELLIISFSFLTMQLQTQNTLIFSPCSKGLGKGLQRSTREKRGKYEGRREKGSQYLHAARRGRKCTSATKRQEARRPGQPHSSPRTTRRCERAVRVERRAFEGPSLVEAAELHARFLASHPGLFHTTSFPRPTGRTPFHRQRQNHQSRRARFERSIPTNYIRDGFLPRFFSFLCKGFLSLRGDVCTR